MFCSNCGKEISEISKFCNFCGAEQKIGDVAKSKGPKKVEIEFVEKEEIPKVKTNLCPKCGSDRITKYLQYQKNKKSGGGDGCLGCLLIIIIFILAPGLVILFGLATGTALYTLRTPIIVSFIIGIILAIVVKIYQADLYICEKCGVKFKFGK